MSVQLIQMPVRFVRQYAGSLDYDEYFATTSARNAYLISPRRWAGMEVADGQTGKRYILNAAKDAWKQAYTEDDFVIGDYVKRSGDSMSGPLIMTGGAAIDSQVTGGSDVLNIGTSNADVINIGYSSSVINIQGTLLYQNVDNLSVKDKLIRLNVGGSAGSGVSSGFEIEEGGTVTGWFSTNSSRNGWDMKAPGSFQMTLGLDLLTANRIIKAPDQSGTIALLSDLSGGYTPLTRALTINGLTQNLTVDRTWTITVTPVLNRTSVSGGAGLTPTIDIASTYIGQASITTVGALSSGSLATGFTPIANVLLANSTISGVALGGNLFTLTFGTHLTGTSYNGSSAVTIGTDATNLNTPGTIVARDGSGNFTAGTITAALVGNASTASTLQTARNISITGDIAWTVSFDGSGNVTAAGTLASVNANVGTWGSATQVAQFVVNAKGLVTGVSNVTITPAASSITGGAALTKTDDTNVTLTLGGTPSAALLVATSLTLGWTGTLADGRIASSSNWNTAYTNRIATFTVTGNSGAATFSSNVLNIPTYTFNGLSPMTTAGDIIYGGASGVGTRLAAGSATQVLHGGTTPSWSAVSLTADISGILASTNGGSGVNNAGTLTWGSGGTLGTAAYTSVGAYEVPLTFSTGLTRSTNTITVNTTQNIVALSNLTTNGFVKTNLSNGTLSVDLNTYLTANQTITLSGDVSGSGTTAIATAIGANKVLNAMINSVAWSKITSTPTTISGYGITDGVVVSSTYYIGTTLNTFNRASASQTLTGVSIDGTAASETLNTVSIRGSTFNGNVAFGVSAINSWGGNYRAIQVGFMGAIFSNNNSGGGDTYLTSNGYFSGSAWIRSSSASVQPTTFVISDGILGFYVNATGSVGSSYSPTEVFHINNTGTITLGIWNGTAISNSYLANSTISGIALGGNLAQLQPGTHLSMDGTGVYYGNATRIISTDATSAATASTIMSRDASGDVFIRLLRTEYTSAGGTNAYFLTQNAIGAGGGTDNYARPMSLASVTSSIQGAASGTWGINISGAAANSTLWNGVAYGGPYLPLAGGTLTGGLIGTTGQFTGALNSNTTIQVGAWNALTYTSGTDLKIGGYNASQWTALNFYTNGSLRFNINSSGTGYFYGALQSATEIDILGGNSYIAYRPDNAWWWGWKMDASNFLNYSVNGGSTLVSFGSTGNIATTGNSISITPSTTTSNSYTGYNNTNGSFYVGKEGSGGGSMLIGSTAYAAVIANYGSTVPIQFGTNNTIRLSIGGGTDHVFGFGTSSPITSSGYSTINLDAASSGSIIELSIGGVRKLQITGTNTNSYFYAPSGIGLNFYTNGALTLNLDTSQNAIFSSSITLGTVANGQGLSVRSGGYSIGHIGGVYSVHDYAYAAAAGDFVVARNVTAGYSNTNLILANQNNGHIYFSFGTGNNDTVKAYITNAGDAYANSFTPLSDRRIKTEIRSNPSFKNIEKIKARLYEKGGRIEAGYYAQDVIGILDCAVSKTIHGYYALSYDSVHTAKIARLETVYEKQEKRISRLEKQVVKLGGSVENI
jgi:hypothetical protein